MRVDLKVYILMLTSFSEEKSTRLRLPLSEFRVLQLECLTAFLQYRHVADCRGVFILQSAELCPQRHFVGGSLGPRRLVLPQLDHLMCCPRRVSW